jgi:hypothetical protein
MHQDQEILALSQVNEALKVLNKNQVKRIVDWVSDRFGLVQTTETVALQTDASGLPTTESKPAFQPVEEPVALRVKKRQGRQPKIVEPGIATAAEPVTPNGSTGVSEFMKFETIEDLFSAVKAKTFSAKILLAGAYLHEARQLKEFKTFDIIAMLKKSGGKTRNISSAINGLLRKKPPVLIQTGKLGRSRRAGRSFRLTEAGMRSALKYIRQ